MSRRECLSTVPASCAALAAASAASSSAPAAAAPWDAKPADDWIVATDRNGAEVTQAGWLASHGPQSGAKPDLVLGPGGDPYFLLLKKTAPPALVASVPVDDATATTAATAASGTTSTGSGEDASPSSVVVASAEGAPAPAPVVAVEAAAAAAAAAAAVPAVAESAVVLESYALRAECTHLGCLVAFDVANGKGFACPCHGSQYAADGSVTRGPAPRSLTLADVSVRDDGKVLLRPWQGADFRTAAAAS
jgi:Rieske Fe-S protein